jgi:hypothetical protein
VGITGSTTGATLGGAVYVENAGVVDVDETTFNSISSVSSGGGLYLSSTSAVATIKNSSFDSIAVSSSGGTFL